MEFPDRELLLVDLETTGLDHDQHEAIEIGAVRVNQHTLELVSTFQAKVKPLFLHRADPVSLRINGYTEEGWRNAVSFTDAWPSFFDFARGSVFASYAVQFDWGFVKRVIRAGYLPFAQSDNMDVRRFGPFDRHLIDIPSIAWGVLGPQKSLSKDKIAAALGIAPEPLPHRALAGALHGLTVLKALRERIAESRYVQAA